MENSLKKIIKIHKFLLSYCLIALLPLVSFISGLQASAQDYISSDAKLEYNQGVDYYKAGLYDKSMASFKRAIQLDPNYIDAYYNLGSILEYLRDDDAALSVFKQIIVRKPDDYDAIYKAAYLSYTLGQSENAVKYLSLIPKESGIYSKAQGLANTLGTDMQTIKSNAAKATIDEAGQMNTVNRIYNNLPSPTGIAGDNQGNIYVACFSDNMIYKITPDGRNIIFVKNPKINGPIGMVNDNQGNLYIANYNGNNIIKITPTGTITNVIANIEKPYGLHIRDNILYISSQGTNSVLKYKL